MNSVQVSVSNKEVSPKNNSPYKYKFSLSLTISYESIGSPVNVTGNMSVWLQPTSDTKRAYWAPGCGGDQSISIFDREIPNAIQLPINMRGSTYSQKSPPAKPTIATGSWVTVVDNVSINMNGLSFNAVYGNRSAIPLNFALWTNDGGVKYGWPSHEGPVAPTSIPLDKPIEEPKPEPVITPPPKPEPTPEYKPEPEPEPFKSGPKPTGREPVGTDVHECLTNEYIDTEPNYRQPQGVKRLISSHRVEYQLFPEEYFSGSDITIYMGDIWVADISRISFSLQEAVRPIYGYASYTWDEVARGSRLCQGQFVIPFRQAGYISGILGHIGQLGTDGGKQLPLIARLMNKDTREDIIGAEAPPQWVGDVREEIEHLLERTAGKNQFEFGKLASTSTQAAQRFRDYEAEIWGRTTSKDIDRRYQTYFYEDRTAMSVGGEKGGWKWQEQFKTRGPSIYITYGPLDEAIKQDYAMVKNGVPFSYTSKALHNIQFTGVSQNIDANGTPIEEVYTFIAQDID